MLGLSYKEIGRALKISPETARYHAARVIQKFGAQNQMRLPWIAFKVGLFST